MDPTTEQARLAELASFQVMDSLEDQAFDDITRAAASICNTPVALITLVDDHRQWFKSRVGTQVAETPREFAFCSHAIETPGQVMVVNDTSADARFATNPLVTHDPHIRFYAGAPLVTPSGHAIGTVCVIDTQPRGIDAQQMEQLQFLAAQVMAMLDERRARLDPANKAGKEAAKEAANGAADATP